MYPGCLGDWYTGFGSQAIAIVPEKHFKFSSFFSFISYVAIHDFTKHLIILNWLTRQKCRQKRETRSTKKKKKKWKRKKKLSVFIRSNT